jgi:hypothetical protein
LAEFLTFVDAFFGALILGVGYLGLWFKYKIDNKNFYKLKTFDKTIQSLILGIFTFGITIQFFELPLQKVLSEQELFLFLLRQFMIILILSLIFVFAIVLYWVIGVQLVKRHFNIIKMVRERIKIFAKRNHKKLRRK